MKSFVVTATTKDWKRTHRDHSGYRVWAVGVLVSVLLIGTSAAAEQVRLAMPSKSMTFMSFYVGEKFGLYKAEGIEISFTVGRADIALAAVVAGEMDYITAIGTVLRAAATGAPVKAFMFSMDKVIFFMMAKPEIKRVQDLKGKSVAVTGLVATDAQGARAMAKAQGVNPDQDLVFLVTGNAANSFAALQGGGVGAAMLSIPFNFKAEGMGFRSLGNTADYLRTPFTGLGGSEAKLKSNPNQVKRMIRATLQGMDFTKDPANQDRVIEYMMEDFKIDRKTAEGSYREIVKALTKDGTTPEDAVRSEIESIREQAKIKGQVPVSQLVDYGLLKEVLAGMKR